MDDKFKIQFADAAAPSVANVFGLPITVSPGASDTLAAVYMVFQMLQGLFVTGVQGQGQPQQVVIPEGYGDEPAGEENTIDLRTIMSLSPTARAEFFRVHGLMVEPLEQEPDPTKAQVNEILREAGIATEPGPGGAWAPGTVVEPEGDER
jgi:hypothetical protein